MTRKEVISYIQDGKFGYLATVDADNAPRVRPVGIKDIYGDDLYFFTFSITRKVAEIDSNPNVEVVWSKLADLSQVRISGKLVVEEDPAIQQRFMGIALQIRGQKGTPEEVNTSGVPKRWGETLNQGR